MNTFLGVSRSLGVAEIDEAALATAGSLYIEGYLSAQPPGLEAARRTRQLAEGFGVPAAVSLSDPSMVTLFATNFKVCSATAFSGCSATRRKP